MSSGAHTRSTEEQRTTEPVSRETGGVPADAPDRTNRGSIRSRVADITEAYALVGLTVALVVFFSLLPASGDAFASADNLRIVAADQAVLMVIAIAVLVPIVTSSWDFSPGATAGLASVFAASVVGSSGSIVLAILAAIGVGAAVGIVNGLLITKAQIGSVIATLGMTIVISGVVQWKTEGATIIAGIPRSLTDFGSGTVLGVPYLALIALALAAVIYVLLTRTVYGRSLFGVGSNRSAARLVGLRTERFVFSTFVISGVLSGIAGVLLLARSGAGNPDAGPGFILPAYAAVFLGATAVSPGRWNVWGVVVAVSFLGVLNSGLTLAGAPPYVNSLVNGFALFIGVGVANVLARRRGRDLKQL